MPLGVQWFPATALMGAHAVILGRLFGGLEPAFLAELAAQMRMMICIPNEYVLSVNSRAVDSMYLVRLCRTGRPAPSSPLALRFATAS